MQGEANWSWKTKCILKILAWNPNTGFKKTVCVIYSKYSKRKRPRDSSTEDIRKKSNIYSFFINGKRKIICKKKSQYFVYKWTIW